MLATLYAITATDAIGNDWIAVKEGNFTGWRLLTPEVVRLRMRMDPEAYKPWPHMRDVYVSRSYAEIHCAQAREALPAFEWSVKRFSRSPELPSEKDQKKPLDRQTLIP